MMFWRESYKTPLHKGTIPNSRTMTDTIPSPVQGSATSKKISMSPVTTNIALETIDVTQLWAEQTPTKQLFPLANFDAREANFGEAVFTYNHKSIKKKQAVGRASLAGLGTYDPIAGDDKRSERKRAMELLASKITYIGNSTNDVFTGSDNFESGYNVAMGGSTMITVNKASDFPIGCRIAWTLPEPDPDNVKTAPKLKFVHESEIFGLKYFSNLNNDFLANYKKATENYDVNVDETKKKSFENVLKHVHTTSMTDALNFLYILLQQGLVVLPELKQGESKLSTQPPQFTAESKMENIELKSLYSDGVWLHEGEANPTGLIGKLTPAEFVLRLAKGMNLIEKAPEHSNMTDSVLNYLKKLRFLFLGVTTYDGTYTNFEFERQKEAKTSTRTPDFRINRNTAEGQFLTKQINNQNFKFTAFFEAMSHVSSRFVAKNMGVAGKGDTTLHVILTPGGLY